MNSADQFETIVNEHHEALYSQSDACDLTQHTFSVCRRSALLLEDYSYKEIAEILATPIGTLKSRIARGVAQLRAILLSDGSRASTALDAVKPTGTLVPLVFREQNCTA